MSPTNLLLSMLIVLRLLLPPGICVCKLSSPAANLLAAARGTEVPAGPAEEDDDHNPGCPACYLALGLGVAPPSGPGPLLLPPAGFVASAPPALHPLDDGLPTSDFPDAPSPSLTSGGMVRPLLC